eukprot:6492700-Amphidinium_carterae.3
MSEVLHTGDLEAPQQDFNTKIVLPARQLVRVILDHVKASTVAVGAFIKSPAEKCFASRKHFLGLSEGSIHDACLTSAKPKPHRKFSSYIGRAIARVGRVMPKWLRKLWDLAEGRGSSAKDGER